MKASYASAASHLLSAILVEATGQSVLDYARDKLFNPLGISTDPAAEPLAVEENLPVYEAAPLAWPVDPQGVHLGDAYLKISAPDMAKIGQLMLAGGRWDDKQIVPAQWVTESTRAHVPTGGYGLGGDDYGYHWWVTTADGHDAFAAAGFEVSSSKSCPTSTSSSSSPARSRRPCAPRRVYVPGAGGRDGCSGHRAIATRDSGVDVAPASARSRTRRFNSS